jgi:hypothetical protein
MMNKYNKPQDSDALERANTVREDSAIPADETADLQYICDLWNATHVTDADKDDMQSLINAHGWELVADILWWLAASPTWYVEITDTESLRLAFAEALTFYESFLRQALEAGAVNDWDEWINVRFLGRMRANKA